MRVRRLRYSIILFVHEPSCLDRNELLFPSLSFLSCMQIGPAGTMFYAINLFALLCAIFHDSPTIATKGCKATPAAELTESSVQASKAFSTGLQS